MRNKPNPNISFIPFASISAGTDGCANNALISEPKIILPFLSVKRVVLHLNDLVLKTIVASDHPIRQKRKFRLNVVRSLLSILNKHVVILVSEWVSNACPHFEALSQFTEIINFSIISKSIRIITSTKCLRLCPAFWINYN